MTMTTSFLDQIFLIRQQQLKLAKRSGTLGQKVVAPLFTRDVLTTTDPLSPEQRLIQYMSRRQGIKLPTISEGLSASRSKVGAERMVACIEKAKARFGEKAA
ncbi:hypothetical protein [uncultured Marinobacter sp.]|uniref:hypothetical protein n=1 Tax=uncultured Marinobacter sp. TaxID=187379 RepID=UPI0030DAD048